MSESESSPRLLSLDAFRGATIASMLWVNNHGTWDPKVIPAQLMHNEWHGCRFTDLIFPFFLFIVGVAMPFSDAKRRAAGETLLQSWGHAAKRALVIFALGVFLQSVRWSTLTFDMEVLQRIAVCYFLAFMVLRATTVAQAGVVVGLYAVYLALMLGVRAPGEPWERRWDQWHTLAEWLDTRWLLTQKPNNEGLLSTLPAVTSVIFGIFAGRLLQSGLPPHRKVALLCRAAGIGMAGGLVFSWMLEGTPLWIPLNKKLWTPSYALVTAGWACMALGLLYWTIDVLQRRRWAQPLVIYGSNALAVYAFSRLFVWWILITWTVNVGWTKMPLKMWIYGHTAAWFGPMGGSFAYSALVVGIGFCFCYWLWRRKWFFRA